MRMAASLSLLLLLAACDRPPEAEGGAEAGMGDMMPPMASNVDTAGLRTLAVPAEHEQGRELYTATCASCHGEAGLGTTLGPPLIHIVYEPNHHGDGAFVLAAERGVRAHHWGFGDMPAQPGITRPEVMEVVGYVRWLQREAGVY
jgi:mono/diheme cytochrome c family protein